ncbi:hypothetical protein [Candidatus Vidania fulgoroideorum]
MMRGITTIEIGLLNNKNNKIDGKIIRDAYRMVNKNNYNVLPYLIIVQRIMRLTLILIIDKDMQNDKYIKYFLTIVVGCHTNIVKCYNSTYKKNGLIIPLGMPIEKVENIIKKIRPYLIYISLYQGRTGVELEDMDIVKCAYKYIKNVRRLSSDIPIMLGFGISRRNCRVLSRLCQYFVMGSEFIKYISRSYGKDKA